MITRRRALLASTAAGLGIVSTVRAQSRKPALRAAHITDVHINGEKNAPAGVAAMFAHMAKAKPELVLNTGDSVMSVDGKATGAQAAAQIAIWKDAVKASPAPIYSCLGNHDIWDGVEPTAEVPATKKGNALMTDVLGMPAPYYSFDKGGWHFIAMNSVCQWPNYGSLSREHFDWLKDDLKKTPKQTPICVLSHLPIVSVTSSLYGDDCRKGNDVVVPGVWQHADCWAISELFRKFPNVKVCLSGHMHTCDRCEYRGVWYICGGAVSGSWWDGSEYGFPPCYGLLDLFADGTFMYEFVDYGWHARKWSGKELTGI